MRAVRRPAVLLSALALAVGGLSGCGDDEPDGSDTMTIEPRDPSGSSGSSRGSSPSSSGSSSSSSTSAKGDAPEIPAEAKKHTDEGAVAFAEWYWHQSGDALKSGDTQAMSAASRDCVPCDKFVELVQKDTEAGLRAESNPLHITDPAISEETDGKSEAAVQMSVKQSSYALIDEEGKTQKTARAADYDLIVYVDWESGAWTVVDMFQILR